MKKMENSGINKIETKRIYSKAENTYAFALSLFGDHNSAVNGVIPSSIPSHAPDATTLARIETRPNLQTLFGSLDYCECSHCRSI